MIITHKRIEKSYTSFSARSLFVLGILEQKPGTNLCHQVWLPSQIYLWSAHLSGWSSLHPNVTNVRYSKGYLPYEDVWIVFCLCELYQKPELFKDDLTLWYKANYVTPIRKYVWTLVLVPRRQMREMREKDFVDQLLHFTLIYLMTDNFSLVIFEKLKFWYNYKNKEGTHPP